MTKRQTRAAADEQTALVPDVVVPDSLVLPHVPPPAMDVEALIMRALDSNVDINTLERLMAMRQELHAEQSRKAFYHALSGFQADCPTIPKTKNVLDKNGRGRYKYAPLDIIVEKVRPAMHRWGLSHTIKAHFDLENKHLVAVCQIHHTDGHCEISEFRVPLDADSYMSAPQKFGSASTYAKRYALCNALGIMTGDEDDDGAAEDDAPRRPMPGQVSQPRPKPTAAKRQTEAKPPPASQPDPAPERKEDGRPALAPAATDEDTISESTLKTLAVQMEKFGLGTDDFRLRFGFEISRASKKDLNAVIAWMKNPEGA